jgi:1-acyl-sn-glycerol-3-phosphate acyltransferase
MQKRIGHRWAGNKKQGNFPKAVSFLGKIYYLLLQHLICRLTGLLLVKKIEGLHNIPSTGPFLLIPNHSSFVDFMLVMDSVRKRRFLSFFIKVKYFDMKIWNHFLLKMKQIRADKASIKKSISILSDGYPVVLFAEGTRTRDGKIGDAYPGLGMVAELTDAPVIPMGIKGAYQFWPWDRKIPNLLQGKKIEIAFGAPMDFEKFADAKVFSTEVMKFVKQLA